jgi:hypothetical protein
MLCACLLSVELFSDRFDSYLTVVNSSRDCKRTSFHFTCKGQQVNCYGTTSIVGISFDSNRLERTDRYILVNTSVIFLFWGFV